MKSLELTPSSTQLDEFYKKVFSFHCQQAADLLWDGVIQFTTSIYDNRTKAATPDQIMFLASSYSKITDVISPGVGTDTHKVDLYNMDDCINDINKHQNYNSYWDEVAWQVYEVLPRFARALGTPFNSGSEMEQGLADNLI